MKAMVLIILMGFSMSVTASVYDERDRPATKRELDQYKEEQAWNERQRRVNEEFDRKYEESKNHQWLKVGE